MFPFKHLPVTSEHDVTANFEQLRVLLPTTQGTLDERYLQQTAAAEGYLALLVKTARKTAFGTVELEWPVKSVSSGTKVVKTGLASIVAFVGQPVAGLTVQVFNVSSVSGGDVTVASTGTGESPIGTKVNAYWIAIGT